MIGNKNRLREVSVTFLVLIYYFNIHYFRYRKPSFTTFCCCDWKPFFPTVVFAELYQTEGTTPSIGVLIVNVC